MKRRLALPALASASALALAACSGGSSSSHVAAEGAHARGTTDVVVSSLGSSELASLRLRLAGARFEHEDGTLGADVQGGPRTLEVVGLDDRPTWYRRARLEPGRYRALVLEIDAAGSEATSLGAAALAVEAAAEPRIVFEPPLVVSRDDHRRVELTMDLDASAEVSDQLVTLDLSEAVGVTVVTGPAGDVPLDGEPGVEIEDVRGVVLAASLIDRSLELDAGPGTARVVLADEVVLRDEEDELFASEGDFFAALVLGVTVVEVRGRLLSDGTLEAERVEIERLFGGPDERVRIDGGIVALDRDAGTFVLLIHEIELGADVAEPVLEELGGPLIVDVAFDDATAIDAGDGDGSPDDLAVGQRVEVEFDTFELPPPFLAARIELEGDEIALHGHVVDTGELPEAFTMRVDEDELSCEMGGVPEEVRVALDDGTRIVLGMEGLPELEPEQLVPGLRVHVLGDWTDLPETDLPALDADRVRVRPGYFIHGVVSSVHPDEHLFQTATAFVVQPFVGKPGPPFHAPLDVEVAPSARFWPDASSEEEFYALFEEIAACHDALAEGTDDDEDDDHGDDHGDDGPPWGDDGGFFDCGWLDVKVRGLGTDVPHRVVAYEVKVKHREH